MKSYIYLVLIVALASCSEIKNNVAQKSFNIIPQPASLVNQQGSLSLDGTVDIIAKTDEERNVAFFLKEFLLLRSIESTIVEQPKNGTTILLTVSDESKLEKEAYELTIDAAGVQITATDGAGLYYGVQSLFQLIDPNESTLPFVAVKDQPRFPYRGMHLDVGRHMFPVSFIKKYIDMMSHFKYNTFHWHLTEDQGWRIEIKKYPKLQTIASQRKETVVGRASSRTRGTDKFDDVPYGGYYTQEEVKEIVAYAAKRYVTIIPEIELPGHAQAALSAYPHLGCTGGPYEAATTWGVFNDVYCAGKESTFEFLQDVFDEVLPLFPGQYVHIGGDESPKDQWKVCQACQKRIASEGLRDEHELQSYFVQRMEKYLNAKGKTIIGWDEILEGGLAQNAVVMSWRGEEGGIEAAQLNHNVIMTPSPWVYFDYYQADPETEPLAIGGMTTVEKVYSYDPLPPQLSADQQKYILGAQCNLWTEYIVTPDYAEYMIYPRAIALSEVLWSPKTSKDYDSFVTRINGLQPLLDDWNINYAKHIFETEDK